MSDATQTTPSSLAALGARFATPWTITLLAPLLVGLLDPDQFVAVVNDCACGIIRWARSVLFL